MFANKNVFLSHLIEPLYQNISLCSMHKGMNKEYANLLNVGHGCKKFARKIKVWQLLERRKVITAFSIS